MKIERPATLQAALALLSERPMRIVAGGTDLIPRLNQGIESCEALCILGPYPEMTGVKREVDGRLFIGALTTLAGVGLPGGFSPDPQRGDCRRQHSAGESLHLLQQPRAVVGRKDVL